MAETDKEVSVSHSKIPRIFVQSLARRQPCCILNFDTRNFTLLRNYVARLQKNDKKCKTPDSAVAYPGFLTNYCSGRLSFETILSCPPQPNAV